MTVKDNTQLIEIMTLLIKIQVKSCTEGILAIETIVKEVCPPFLKKGLIMCLDGVSGEYIKEILQVEIDSSDTYNNILIEGCEMVGKQHYARPGVMLETFKSHLSFEDQSKLDSMAGGLVKEFDEMCERGEVPN